MRQLLLVSLLAVVAGSGGQPSDAASPEQLIFVRDGDLWSAGPDGSKARRLTRSTASESEPALASDGFTLAFTSNRTGENEIYRAQTDDWAARPLSRNHGRDDSSPAWSPDGRKLAWTSDGDVYTMNAAGNARRSVATTAAREVDPTWSPDGRELAYAADGDLFVTRVGGTPRALTSGSTQDAEPDWSPRGELAFVRDGAIHVVSPAGGEPRRLTAGPNDSAPSWSPSGRRLVFARARADGSDLLVIGADGAGVGRILAGGQDPDWGLLESEPPPEQERPDELLPDLDQRAPTGLSIITAGTRFKLGFVSAVDNVGRGPVWIVASRPNTAVPVMRAVQLVARKSGGRRVYRGAGIVRYTWSPTHSHWHYLRFMSYELRRAGDFRLIVRDRKSGFCLADHYGYAAARLGIPRLKARFVGNCAQRRPDARWVEQGSSVGYTDRYPAHFHGQNVDVTGVTAGTYWLVHRANPAGALRELVSDNNAAAILVRLGWSNGQRRAPTLNVLRVCEGAERCGPLTPP